MKINIKQCMEEPDTKSVCSTKRYRHVVDVENRTDHKGNVYDSKKEMCKAYGISQDAYTVRTERLGWSKKDALEIQVRGFKHVCKTSTDHTGKEHASVKDMCDYWGVCYATYLDRLKHGYSLEEALTYRVRKEKTQPVDHLGNRFKNVAEMCMHYSISVNAFCSRIFRGWTLERALTEELCESSNIKCTDHLGNEYDSRSEMLKHYGISMYIFKTRIAAGMELENVLTDKVRIRKSIECEDHIGNCYSSRKEMLQHYGVTQYMFNKRLSEGMTLEQALTAD